MRDEVGGGRDGRRQVTQGKRMPGDGRGGGHRPRAGACR